MNGPPTLRGSPPHRARQIRRWVRTALLASALAGTARAYDASNTAYVGFTNTLGSPQAVVSSSTTFTVTTSPNLTLTKFASQADIFQGQTTVYSLLLINNGPDTAYNVVVIDTLPAVLAWAGAAGGPAPDAGWAPAAGPPQRIRWTITELGVCPLGCTVFTAEVKALDPGAVPVTATNVARVHYQDAGKTPYTADAAPVDVTVRPAVLPAAPGSLTGRPAGATLALGWTPSAAGTFPVSGYNIYRSTSGSVVPSATSFLGQAVGATVTSFVDGAVTTAVTYCYVARAVDVLGNEGPDSAGVCLSLTVTAGVVVPPPPPPPPPPGTIRLVVNVFDVSGRLIKTVFDGMVPAPVTVTRVGDGAAAVLASGGGVDIVLSDGTRLVWDGRETSGAVAPNGLYTVRAADTLPDGRQLVSAATVAVTRAYARLIEDPVLVPNPAADVAWIGWRLAVTTGEVGIRVYNLAGELVFTGRAPGTARSYRWDLKATGGHPVSNGFYLVLLDAEDPATGARDRQILRLAVSR